MNARTCRWLTGMGGAVLFSALGFIAWSGLHTTAYAQVPDSGAQRAAMIHELRALGGKLDKIALLLTEIRDQKPPNQIKPPRPGNVKHP